MTNTSTALPTKDLGRLQENMKKNRSLPSSSSRINDALDERQIDEMTSSEFDKYFDQVKRQQKKIDKEYFGGY